MKSKKSPVIPDSVVCWSGIHGYQQLAGYRDKPGMTDLS